MKRKELTKTFMMISDCIKHFGPHGLYRNISWLEGLTFLLLGAYVYISDQNVTEIDKVVT